MTYACRSAWAIALWLLLVSLPLRAEPSHPTWDEAFPTAAAPTEVYFRADYLDGFGKPHRLQVWRDADRRLRRRTDELIDLYVERSGDGDYGYRLVVHARKTIIRADRAMLYRIGIFSDWRSLAYVLDPPRGTYGLARDPSEAASTSAESCDWFRLEAGSPSRVSRVCWSRRWGVPLAIDAMTSEGAWTRRFTVEHIRVFRADARIFAPPDGLVQVDEKPGDEQID